VLQGVRSIYVFNVHPVLSMEVIATRGMFDLCA
jgi:hypothetical protein